MSALGANSGATHKLSEREDGVAALGDWFVGVGAGGVDVDNGLVDVTGVIPQAINNGRITQSIGIRCVHLRMMLRLYSLNWAGC